MSGPIITDGAGVDRLWPFSASKTSHVKTLEMSFRAALSSKDALENHQSSLRSTGRLTDRGLADEVRSFGRSNVVPALAKGTVAVQRAKDAVAAKRSQLTAPAIDKTDIVSAFAREGIRESIRKMPAGQRDEMLTRHLDKLSTQVMQAVLENEALPWVQDADKLVSDKTRNAIAAHLIQITHPAAIAEIAEIEQAIDYSFPTIETAAAEIQRTLAMRAGEFSAAVEAEVAASPVRAAPVLPPVAATDHPAPEPKISTEMEELWNRFDNLVATGR
jgi:hypothetical protein